jgi:hypothetical protein
MFRFWTRRYRRTADSLSPETKAEAFISYGERADAGGECGLHLRSREGNREMERVLTPYQPPRRLLDRDFLRR